MLLLQRPISLPATATQQRRKREAWKGGGVGCHSPCSSERPEASTLLSPGSTRSLVTSQMTMEVNMSLPVSWPWCLFPFSIFKEVETNLFLLAGGRLL